MSHITGKEKEKKNDTSHRQALLSEKEIAERRKLATLVALAFIVLLLAWAASWRWTYNTKNAPKASSLFTQIEQSISPELKKAAAEKNEAQQ